MNGHQPVLLQPVVELLRAGEADVRRLIDGTVGAGGHAAALLEAGVEHAIAIDRDASALALARRKLAGFGERVALHQASYTEMRLLANERGWRRVDAILLDLGASSMQMDDASRGFSFRYDAPLDMRFEADADQPSARDLVNGLPADALADLFFRYGEEPHARRIARAIVEKRPLETTRQLAELAAAVKPADRRRQSRLHPATQVFQALRIAVNGELEAIETVLPIAVDLLRPGGRLAVIAFHSLEDRLVKVRFRELSTTVHSPPGMASIQGRRATVKRVTGKPIRPGRAEIQANPRSRSAKLRVIEKLDWARA